MSTSFAISRRTFIRSTAAATAMTLAAPALIGRAWAAPAKLIVSGPGGRTEVHQEFIKALGYFEEFDVEPTFESLADGSKILAAVISGAADACMMAGIAPVFPAVDKGAKLKIIAGANMLPSYVLMTHNPEIKTIEDLEGKTVATGSPGALVDELTMLLLKKRGLDASNVNFVNVGGTSEIFRAVVAKTVDAGIGTVPFYLEREKYGVYAVEGGLAFDELPQYTAQGSFTSDRAIEVNRDAIVRCLAAHAKSYRFLQNDPASKDVYLAAYKKVFPAAAEAEAAGEWQYIQEKKPYAGDLVVSQERIDFIQDLNVAKGSQLQKLPYETLADMTLATDAVAMLG